jgi:CHAT domain-containing protein/tetratricopeptide (TPR) repeat protein
MRPIGVAQALSLVTISLLLLAFVPAASAQQPSRELQNLQDTTRDLYQAGSYDEALQYAERALPLVIREFGAEHEQVSIQTYSLGLISERAGKLDKAEQYYAQTLRLREKIYGQDSPSVAIALENLGGIYVRLKRIDPAEPLFQRALKIRQDAIGPNHAFSATGHANLGTVYLARGNWAAALASYRQAIRLLVSQDTSFTVVKSIVEDDIRRNRDTFVGLCRAAWQTRSSPGTSQPALVEETFAAAQNAWHTSAASALAKMTARLGASNTELGQRIRQVQDLSDRVLALHAEDNKLLADWSKVQRADRAYSALLDEFRALSIARAKQNAPVAKQQKELIERLTGSLERCPPGQAKAGCENANREREQIGKQLGELSKAASAGTEQVMAVHGRMDAAEKALPGHQDFTTRRNTLRAEIDRYEREEREARTKIIAAYPDYAALTDPKPLSVAESQALLKGDEVMVVVLVGSERSFVWAVTRERAEWAEIDASNETLGEHVRILRNGLDPLAQLNAEGSPGSRAGVKGGFDLQRAHELYKLVLGPVAAILEGKRHLIVVPTGPLTSLPLQVLITRPPQVSGGDPTPDELRNAAWLIKSHAMSVLPSVQSLSALRKLAQGSPATDPFFGMGDPVLQGGNPTNRGVKRVATNPARFYRSGLADVRAVSELAPLPDTADELRAIGKVLGASPDAINLREAASELRVKTLPLNNYRVIQFATHGLVAGDLSGLAEPALVLTPPEVPTEANDGLLTASEIAALRLNADWVVLSACNTAAGSDQGAEALSGLARAFFYAGARALMVSHWAVYSDAAVVLTTKTFSTLAASPKIGRAEAFRTAMLSLIAEGKPPSHWAPFVVVGEGGAQ